MPCGGREVGRRETIRAVEMPSNLFVLERKQVVGLAILSEL
jgi:hypothetical protein